MQKEYNQKIENKDPSAVEAEKKQEKDGELDSSHQLLVEYMHLDLSSLSSTVEFVKAFKQTGYPLHVLICNAGIAFVNQGGFACQVLSVFFSTSPNFMSIH